MEDLLAWLWIVVSCFAAIAVRLAIEIRVHAGRPGPGDAHHYLFRRLADGPKPTRSPLFPHADKVRRYRAAVHLNQEAILE